MGPSGPLAADDGLHVPGLQGVVGVGQGVGCGVGVQEKRAALVRSIGFRRVKRSAIVDGERARRAFQRYRLGRIKARFVFRRQTAHPFTGPVVLVVKFPGVASGHHHQRPLVRAAVIQVSADGQGTVIGVRPELDVLMPFHFLASLGPFEIELRVVELDIRPH